MTRNKKTDFMLGPLLFLMTILFINFCARMIFSPLLVTLETEFGVSHAEAGRFFLFLSAPYGIMMLFSGFVSKKVRHRGAIFLSIMIAGTGVFLVSRSSSLVLFKAGLILTGLGGGLYVLIGAVFLQPMVVATFFPAFLTALSKLIPPRMRNVATSVLIPFGYLFGGGVAPSFLGFLADPGYFPLGITLLGGIMIAALPLLRTLRIARKLVAAED